MRLYLAACIFLYCLRDATALYDADYEDAVEKFRTRNERVDTIVSLFAEVIDEVVQKAKNDRILIKGYDKKGKTIHMKGVTKKIAELLETYLLVGREDRERQQEMLEEMITEILIPMIQQRERVNDSIKQFDLLRAGLPDNETFADFQAGRTQLTTVLNIEKYLESSLASLLYIGDAMRLDIEEGREYSAQRTWIMAEIADQLELETGEKLDIEKLKDLLP